MSSLFINVFDMFVLSSGLLFAILHLSYVKKLTCVGCIGIAAQCEFQLFVVAVNF